MFNLIYYHLYIKIIKPGSYPTFKSPNRLNKLSYQLNYLFLIILISIFNSIKYIDVLILQKDFYFFFIKHISFMSSFWQFFKKPFFLFYLYNYIYKYRSIIFKS
jgi:hypothetical protein